MGATDFSRVQGELRIGDPGELIQIEPRIPRPGSPDPKAETEIVHLSSYQQIVRLLRDSPLLNREAFQASHEPSKLLLTPLNRGRPMILDPVRRRGSSQSKKLLMEFQ